MNKEVINPHLLKNINEINKINKIKTTRRQRKLVLINTTEYISEYIEGNNYPEFSFTFALDSIPLNYQFVRVGLRQIPELGDLDVPFIPGAKAAAYPSSFKFFPNSPLLTGSFVVRGQKGVFILSISGDGTEDYEPIQLKLVIRGVDVYENPPLPRAQNLFKYKTSIIEQTMEEYIQDLHEKKVVVIQNVYQGLYCGGVKPTGFGDFIRGCYFILQFCKKHNFKSNIIINHPIAMCLKHFDHLYRNKNKNKEANIEMNKIFDNINKFEGNNFLSCVLDKDGYIIGENINDRTIHEFIGYLNGVDIMHNTLFTYNILFPYDVIEEKDKSFMRFLLEPNEVMVRFIDETIVQLGIQKYKYTVIHIRCGDEYLCENSSIFTKKYLTAIFDEIIKIIDEDLHNDYLLISDNNLIKNLVKLFLSKKYKNIKMLYNPITHVGETTVLDVEKVKNTMLDFYLLANSSSIHSISVYTHGSGFSYWCAKTYNIPYKCKFIEYKVSV